MWVYGTGLDREYPVLFAPAMVDFSRWFPVAADTVRRFPRVELPEVDHLFVVGSRRATFVLVSVDWDLPGESV